MSLSSILSVAKSAIFAHQAAAEVVSHNIANADVEGYSRQRADFVTSTPTVFPYGSIGTGVTLAGVSRMREAVLDTSFRTQSGASSAASTRRDVLTEVQGIFGEPQDQGLATAMDAFWSAWSDLSNNPGNVSAQAVVQQRGAAVAQMLNQYDARLTDVAQGDSGRILNSVDQVNQLATQMANLNVQVIDAQASGNQAPDLLDERDRVADQLAALTGARTLPQANGTYAIVIGGTTLVDGANARTLGATKSTTGWTITAGGSPDPVLGVGGSIGALVGIDNTDIPSLRAKLDGLAKGVVAGVNFLHEQGWTPAGDALGNANWTGAPPATGSRVDFFDPAGTTAATIKLSSAVRASSAVIAAGITQNGPGDNSLALQLSQLRDITGMNALQTAMDTGLGSGSFASMVGLASGVSYGDDYRSTVTKLGLDVSSSESDATATDALSSQAAKRRESVFGVSIDEELTSLMKHQQAFAAASRIVTTVDEMMQTLLDMKH